MLLLAVVAGVVVLVVDAKTPLPLQPLLGLAWSPVWMGRVWVCISAETWW